MKVLIVGGGGREHAIAYSLHKSSKVKEIHAVPGNPGIAKIGTCHKGNVEDIESILKFVEENYIDFTVVGPEVPLCLGLVDLLESHGHLAFGPRQKASMLEGSKVFSKEFMIRHNIPTAKYQSVSTYNQAIEALKDFSYPVVVKAVAGITLTCDKTTIKVAGIDKELVGQFAAKIRDIKPVEPYHAYGISYSDEVIVRKEVKSGKK